MCYDENFLLVSLVVMIIIGVSWLICFLLILLFSLICVNGLKMLILIFRFCCSVLISVGIIVFVLYIKIWFGWLVCMVFMYICNVWLICCCKLVVNIGSVFVF